MYDMNRIKKLTFPITIILLLSFFSFYILPVNAVTLYAYDLCDTVWQKNGSSTPATCTLNTVDHPEGTSSIQINSNTVDEITDSFQSVNLTTANMPENPPFVLGLWFKLSQGLTNGSLFGVFMMQDAVTGNGFGFRWVWWNDPYFSYRISINTIGGGGGSPDPSYSFNLNDWLWIELDYQGYYNGASVVMYVNGTQRANRGTFGCEVHGDQSAIIVYHAVTWYSGGTARFDYIKFTSDLEYPPADPAPNTVNVFASPADVGSVGFIRDSGTARTTPYEENVSVATHVWERSEATKTKNSTCIYGFDYWMVTNSSGSFNVTGSTITLYINEPTNITLVYSVHLIRVTSSPEVSADFTESGYTFTTSQNIYRGNFSHTFTPESTIPVNATFQYQFTNWLLNGTSYVGTTLAFTSDYPTNVTLVYTLAYVPPVIPFIYNTGALNATYYMRSDTHTIHDELGYKLLTENTQTPAFDEKLSATTQNVSYGIRVWTVSYLGYEYELTSGNPVGIVTKTDAGGEMLVANWNCPAWSSMIDSLKVRVYQRFDSEAWSLRRIFITKTGLYYRLPAGSWTIHYYVIRTVGSTNSTFGHGSYTTFNSRIDLQYYKANPWELALARLMQRNYLGFLFTPWTYWFGDLFWTIILFGCIIMFYLRTGSLKPVLALLWILGGSGSILWALIPATALHIAVIMLALAMTFSILRLISK
jgi:hypothetical protein